MLQWFNKESTSSASSPKSTEGQQHSQPVNSALTESDYEFLFNQLLDGVAHGWHLGKIIKFFGNLEARSNIQQWIEWVEKFEQKINYSSDPSQKKVGAIMMRFGDLTKPNEKLQQLGEIFHRIGNQLFLGTSVDLVWEYSGQDLIENESQPSSSELVTGQEKSNEILDEANTELIQHNNSIINNVVHNNSNEYQGEFELNQDSASQPKVESLEDDDANQNYQDLVVVNVGQTDQELEQDLAAHSIGSDQEQVAKGRLDQSKPLLNTDGSVDEEVKVIEDVDTKVMGQISQNFDEHSVLEEANSEEIFIDQSFAEELSIDPIEQILPIEFSAEEDLINKAFEENLAAQYRAAQNKAAQNEHPNNQQSAVANDLFTENEDTISDEELINKTFEENLASQTEDNSTQSPLVGKFSPEEELINRAFEEGLAAQAHKLNSSSSVTAGQNSDDSNTGVNDRQVVLDLSLDLPTNDVHLDEDKDEQGNDNHLIISEDFDQESSELSNFHSKDIVGVSAKDDNLDIDKTKELQKLKVDSNELKVSSKQFSVGSFLEATENLSTNPDVADKKVTVTWEEFVAALEQDPALARNVAQQLGMVGVNSPQAIVKAAVDRFRNQKQNQLSPANTELVKSWFQLGLKQASVKDFQGAITSWNQALSLNPNLSEAWHNKGSALGRLGNYVEAIQSFNRAVHLDPQSYQAWNDRAHALYKMQEWLKAIASWDRAIQIMPDRHQFWYNRGCALEQIKSFDESIASYEKALEIKPDFQPARARHTILITNHF